MDGVPGVGKRRKTVTALVVRPAYRVGRMRRGRNYRTGGFLGVEKKFYDTSLTQATLAVTATAAEHNPSATVSLNTVAQGDGESNRDGRQLSMDTITLKGAIEIPTGVDKTTVPLSCYCYVAIVLDKQTNGALLNSEDVFINEGGINSLVGNPFRNLQFIKRFSVLASKRIFIPAQTTQYDGTNIEWGGKHIPFTLNAKLKGMKVTFKGTTAAISNIVDNGLNVIAYCTSVATAPVLSYKARLRFFG